MPSEKRVMVIGMFFGAWMFSRHGWAGVSWSAGTVAVLSLIDRMFGIEIGRRLAEATLALF